MKAQWYVHLPGVALVGTDEIPIGLGRLVRLPFSDWSRLDDSFSWNERHYEQSQPIFYTGEASLSDDQNAALIQVSNWARDLHLAFLLAPGTPFLPSPQMSVSYLRWVFPDDSPVQSVWLRSIGPFEREWIVFGSRIQVTFDNEQLAEVQRAYDLLAAFDPDGAFPGVEAGLHALELTTRPECCWDDRRSDQINSFVHCMTATEHIILPARDDAPLGMKLTPTFGRHAAVITNPSRDGLAERARGFSDLYRLRSRLIHGEIGIAELEEDELALVGFGRLLLRQVILQAMALGQTKCGEESLPRLLGRAYEDADIHRLIFQQLGEVQS
jgi:hypothetical protein